MPTVLRQQGLSIRILHPPREHGPPHVHVTSGHGTGRGEVVIRLAVLLDRPERTGPVELWHVSGMTAAEVSRAVRLVEAHHDYLVRCWFGIHGGPSGPSTSP